MSEQAREHIRQMRALLGRLEADLAATESPADPSVYTFSDGETIREGVNRDPSKLLPPFAAKVEALFQALRARGFDPLLWEGYRSPERAQALSDRGSGIKLSLHCLGAAADIIHAEDYWQASEAFWDALGEEAESLGLTWGGRWKRRDLPHVQALPVRDQNRFRSMTEDERLAYLSPSPSFTSSSG